MIDLSRDRYWDEALRPDRDDGGGKWSEAEWLARTAASVGHLDPLVPLQWIYRHWDMSPYQGLPLARLSCVLETWTTQRILTEVGWRLPEWDRQPEVFLSYFRGKQSEPFASMDATGTWNIPPVVLATPTGVRTEKGDFPDARYWLIEGHVRRRYLGALASSGEGGGHPDARHNIFMLRLDEEPG